MNSYEKGKRWGFAVFNKQVENYGNLGIRKSDKACMTCSKYVNSKKKNGKTLTKKQQEFYKGAVHGFQEFYNKKILK